MYLKGPELDIFFRKNKHFCKSVSLGYFATTYIHELTNFVRCFAYLCDIIMLLYHASKI